jgi:hypothetical protein
MKDTTNVLPLNATYEDKISEAQFLQCLIVATMDLLRFVPKTDPYEYARLQLNLHHLRQDYRNLTGCDWTFESADRTTTRPDNVKNGT